MNETELDFLRDESAFRPDATRREAALQSFEGRSTRPKLVRWWPAAAAAALLAAVLWTTRSDNTSSQNVEGAPLQVAEHSTDWLFELDDRLRDAVTLEEASTPTTIPLTALSGKDGPVLMLAIGGALLPLDEVLDSIPGEER